MNDETERLKAAIEAQGRVTHALATALEIVGAPMMPEMDEWALLEWARATKTVLECNRTTELQARVAALGAILKRAGSPEDIDECSDWADAVKRRALYDEGRGETKPSAAYLMGAWHASVGWHNACPYYIGQKEEWRDYHHGRSDHELGFVKAPDRSK